MDPELDPLLVSVRADTGAFASDVAAMRSTLESGLGEGADRAARAVETGLLRAVTSGKLGFDELRKVALTALDDIARSALRSGLNAVLGGSGGELGNVLSGLLGAPGRATGGPVSPDRAYLVGERGPELFVPTNSGAIAASPSAAPRDVRVAITINASGDAAPQALQQSSRQIARAVKAALTTG